MKTSVFTIKKKVRNIFVFLNKEELMEILTEAEWLCNALFIA